MKNMIYFPADIARLRPVLTDQFFILAQRIAEDFNFKIIFTRHIIPTAVGADIVFIFAGAHGKDLLHEATFLPKGTKVIFYLGGMHSFGPERERLRAAMDRADFITSGCNEKFRELWPEHQGKFEFLHNFFAPQKRYTGLRWNRSPRQKCLLTGHTEPNLYPLRWRIKKEVMNGSGMQEKIDVMQHPRWHFKQTRAHRPWELAPELNDSYAKRINQYFCGIATASRYNYALAKYAEIPAAGALLLGEKIRDIDEMGFIPWVHFVPISGKNVFDVIDTVLAKTEQFNGIRRKGRDFVRKRHGVEARIKQFGKIMERING